MGRPESSPNTPVGSARAFANHKRNLAKEAAANGGVGKDAMPSSAASTGSTASGANSRASTPVAAFVSMPLDLTLPEYAFAASKASKDELEAALVGLTSPAQQKLSETLARLSTTSRAKELQVLPAKTSPPTLDEFARLMSKTGLSDVKAALGGVSEKNQQKLAATIAAASVQPPCTQEVVVEPAGLSTYIAAAKTSSATEVQAALSGLSVAQRQQIGNILAGLDKDSEAKIRTPPKEAPAPASVGPSSSGDSKFFNSLMVAAITCSPASELKAVFAGVPHEELRKLSDALSRC